MEVRETANLLPRNMGQSSRDLYSYPSIPSITLVGWLPLVAEWLSCRLGKGGHILRTVGEGGEFGCDKPAPHKSTSPRRKTEHFCHIPVMLEYRLPARPFIVTQCIQVFLEDSRITHFLSKHSDPIKKSMLKKFRKLIKQKEKKITHNIISFS